MPQKIGHVDRLRAEEKWQSRARLTETSFGFLEAEKNEESLQLPALPQKKAEVEDWHFEKPHVSDKCLDKGCVMFKGLQQCFVSFSSLKVQRVVQNYSTCPVEKKGGNI